jgi:hypothetical protein
MAAAALPVGEDSSAAGGLQVAADLRGDRLVGSTVVAQFEAVADSTVAVVSMAEAADTVVVDMVADTGNLVRS